VKRGLEKAQADGAARGGACVMGVPKGTEHWNLLWIFFSDSIPLLTYAAGCDHHFAIMKP
jgi:hypothetical protein